MSNVPCYALDEFEGMIHHWFKLLIVPEKLSLSFSNCINKILDYVKGKPQALKTYL